VNRLKNLLFNFNFRPYTMEELLGQPLHFRVKVTSARGLLRALCRGVSVKYAHDDGDGRGAREQQVWLARLFAYLPRFPLCFTRQTLVVYAIQTGSNSRSRCRLGTR
jgi:hypothetical protein